MIVFIPQIMQTSTLKGSVTMLSINKIHKIVMDSGFISLKLRDVFCQGLSTCDLKPSHTWDTYYC